MDNNVMKTLHEAITQVNEAMEKVEAVAEELGIILPGDTISVDRLAAIVGRHTYVDSEIAEKVLRYAIDFISDMDLTIGVDHKEEEDDDDA